MRERPPDAARGRRLRPAWLGGPPHLGTPRLRANRRERRSHPPEVSVIVLTHNAFRHVLTLFASLSRTRRVAYEVVVIDNRSRWPVRAMLVALSALGALDVLCLLDRNRLFAAGNNVGVAASSPESRHVLLLNSDVQVRDPLWLRKLLDFHRPGISGLGVQHKPLFPRPDGWCLLIDRELYLRHGLDERHAWHWCVSKLQAEVLREGLAVRGVKDHRPLVVHAGGGSGRGFEGAAGMDERPTTVEGWFDGRRPEIVAALP